MRVSGSDARRDRSAHRGCRDRQWSARCAGVAGVAVLTAVALAVGALAIAPPYTLHPCCTWTRIFETSATIEIGGRTLTATAVHQETRSRDWVIDVNSAGCLADRGEVLAFRDGARVVLIGTRLCRDAVRELDAEGASDVKRACIDRRELERPFPEVFVVDDADHPTSWAPLRSGEGVRVIAWTATRAWRRPMDVLDTVAPEVRRTDFVGAPYDETPAHLGFRRRFPLLHVATLKRVR